MMAFRPRPRAPAAYSNRRSGVRWADTTRTSCAIPRESSTSAAHCMVSQSEDDPIMIPTRAFMPVVYQSLPEQLAEKRKKLPCADGRALFQALLLGLFQQFGQRGPVRLRILLEQLIQPGAGLRQQPIAPALNLLELPNLQIVALFTLRELGEHGFRVDVAHQLA